MRKYLTISLTDENGKESYKEIHAIENPSEDRIETLEAFEDYLASVCGLDLEENALDIVEVLNFL